MSPIDIEKNTTPNEVEVVPVASTDAKVVVETEVVSLDGDDALKLAGTHVYHFDDKYYARLRWKIVRALELNW
jgi:hypothetical protein